VTFATPDRSLGTLETDAVAKLIAAAGDVALILDRDGIVVDVAFHQEEFGAELSGSPAWIGRRWTDIVTQESRDKVETLLQEATNSTIPRWRHINHAIAGGSVPILYTAIQVSVGRMVAIGRNLKAIASLQQRLVEAQQSMERDYSKLRLMEMRYRLLFQMSHEPFFIVDASTLRIIEINPAAVRVLGRNVAHLVGRSVFDVFDTSGAAAVRTLLSVIRATGRADDVRARPADGEQEFDVSASLLRNEEGQLFLMRFSATQTAAQVPKIRWKLLKLVESAPDGFVVTNSEGRILTANANRASAAEMLGLSRQSLYVKLRRYGLAEFASDNRPGS
jgi:transcriptional regulator PpsR